PASSATLGDALRRVARYSTIHNEGVHIRYSERDAMAVTFEYRGVSRLNDRHQIEFFITTLVRLCQQLTGTRLLPCSIKLIHRRATPPPELRAFFGGEMTFGSGIDEVAYASAARRLPAVSADPFLNSLLVKYCEQALASRREKSGQWRLSVENAIAPLLPHG